MKFNLDNFNKSIKEMTIKAGFKIIDQNPEKNVDKLFQLTEKIGKDEFTKDKIRSVKRYYDEIPSIKEYLTPI